MITRNAAINRSPFNPGKCNFFISKFKITGFTLNSNYKRT